MPLQLARLVILSYPWFPDTLALTSWLAAEAGDPQAMAFFTSSSQSLRAQNAPSAPHCLSISSIGGSGQACSMAIFKLQLWRGARLCRDIDNGICLNICGCRELDPQQSQIYAVLCNLTGPRLCAAMRFAEVFRLMVAPAAPSLSSNPLDRLGEWTRESEARPTNFGWYYSLIIV